MLVARSDQVSRLLVATDGTDVVRAIPDLLRTWGVFQGMPAEAVSVAPSQGTYELIADVSGAAAHAASGGAIILTAGTKGKRYALPNSKIMVHQPWGGITGQAEDIRIQAEEILRDKRILNEILAKHTGRAVETIEAQNQDGTLSALQRAFHEHLAAQCGYCTPGMIMSAANLLTDSPKPSEPQIREWISGNFCRCTGYQHIVNAIQHAAGKGAR